jgi:hypothetical protein
MPTYAAPIDNFRFVLNDALAVGETMEKLGLTEATPDVLEAVIEEAGKLCTNVLQPLYDEQHPSCTLPMRCCRSL